MKTTLQARFDDIRLNKLESIKAQTGLTTSQLLRRLVDAAEVEPAKINVNLFANAESDTTRQGKSVAFSV